jgi:hypothetical protein
VAQPLYFLPNLRKAACDSVPLLRSVLKERGLAEVLADVPHDHLSVSELGGRGPGNLPGCILAAQTAAGDMPRRLGYFEKEQTWTRVTDGLWIGVDSAEPPTPAELQRIKLCRGYEIDLDGQTWQVPVIRRSDPAKPTLLPSAFSLNPAGQQVESVRAAYRGHWEAFRDVAAWVYDGMPEGRFSVADLVELAIQALSINYRFGWNEQNVMQPIDSENFLSVIGVAVDYPAFKAACEAQKKMNEPAVTQNTTPGETDDFPTTSQAGAI